MKLSTPTKTTLVIALGAVIVLAIVLTVTLSPRIGGAGAGELGPEVTFRLTSSSTLSDILALPDPTRWALADREIELALTDVEAYDAEHHILVFKLGVTPRLASDLTWRQDKTYGSQSIFLAANALQLDVRLNDRTCLETAVLGQDPSSSAIGMPQPNALVWRVDQRIMISLARAAGFSERRMIEDPLRNAFSTEPGRLSRYALNQSLCSASETGHDRYAATMTLLETVMRDQRLLLSPRER